MVLGVQAGLARFELEALCGGLLSYVQEEMYPILWTLIAHSMHQQVVELESLPSCQGHHLAEPWPDGLVRPADHAVLSLKCMQPECKLCSDYE